MTVKPQGTKAIKTSVNYIDPKEKAFLGAI